jgi:hypothetical protein
LSRLLQLKTFSLRFTIWKSHRASAGAMLPIWSPRSALIFEATDKSLAVYGYTGRSMAVDGKVQARRAPVRSRLGWPQYGGVRRPPARRCTLRRPGAARRRYVRPHSATCVGAKPPLSHVDTTACRRSYGRPPSGDAAASGTASHRISFHARVSRTRHDTAVRRPEQALIIGSSEIIEVYGRCR